ncbi:MAG: tautomerase family protein [Symbiobacteriaceae bacterium]|nr:tautomerase family protein [Symbiobacteriaceae bacterium]
MPLITVKMWPGRSEEQKKAAAEAILQAAVQAMGTPSTAFTIIIEDIPKEEWEETVVKPEIDPKEELVYIRQGVSVKSA